MVKMLVEAYPQAMLTTADDDIQSTPIHVVVSNSNIKNKCEIITQLLDSEPSSIRYVDDQGRTLLARACGIRGVDSLFEVIQLLLNAWPEALMIGDESGCLPVHCICCNSGLGDSTSLDLLHLLIDDDATSLRIVDDYGFIPLHYAVFFNQSTDFCKELTGLYPQSVWAESSDGDLPIHFAAGGGRVDIVRHLLKVCPESVHVTNNKGYLPIHMIARFPRISEAITPEGYVEVLELLLEYDPNAASVAESEKLSLPLHLACAAYSKYLPVVKLLFDQYPKAIWAKDEDGNTPLDLVRWRQNKKDPSDTTVIDFLEDQLKYVTEDMILDGNESTTRSVFWSNLYKCTQDGSGSLPLHHSLQNNASLGVIKVLLYGNSDTLRVVNHQGLLPVHIACQYSSVTVVKFLAEEHENDTLSLNNNGPEKNSALHFACRGGNYKTINYLLDKQAAFVSVPNADKKLPIHLLCESGEGEDESVAHVETIYRMLLANPEL